MDHGVSVSVLPRVLAYYACAEQNRQATGSMDAPQLRLCCLSLYGKYTHSRALFTAGRGLQLLRLETGQSRRRYIEYIFCTTCPSIPGWEPPETCIHMTILDAAMQTPPRLRPSPGASAEKLRRHDCSCIGCLRGFHADPPDDDDADDDAAATSIRTRLGGSKDTTRISQPPKDSDSI
ncbi:uncharacterized protein K489DRAFT_370669 [Dissoconium aciculare CBS 342.82]|uniref:Uncharacterized protein n=1 Tax=Dissoconium aciculare CBS 342.82 TaxID=1314786 RepID=A0A6J3M4X1_9PEZI|nr:uncharacterized protein K489DRAFT_370669 [Dissoconium aciculare CBS 342.82]KAF1823081.1 hypothetical protein K489DRAFT_370669 [Dissoconium aciculare CBS 342.82]